MTTEKKPAKKRAAAGTVHLPEIIEDTIRRIKIIDKNGGWDQSEKTRRHRALAESVKNKLHEDGRKKADNKVGLATYRRYLTNVRSAITEQNWHHHSLQSKVKVLSDRYPELAGIINSIPHKNISDTRIRYHEVLKDMRHNSSAYEDVKALKLDHEIMRWLTLPSAKKALLAEEHKHALEEKKYATINIEYPWLMATIKSLLAPDTNKKSLSFSRLALGIAFATGRRAIEVLYQGRFKKAGEYELKFSGTAKKRGGADYSKEYCIYSLVPADDVIAAIALLKQQPEIQALSVLDELPELKRNTAINQKMGKTLNETSKRVWMNRERVFKDSRPVWARIVFERHFKNDPRWKKVDEDVFWHEMMVHENTDSQKAYKQFKVIDFGKEPSSCLADGRLEAVKALLNNPAIQSRGALLKITTWAIEVINKDPSAIINQHKIIEGCGSGRKVIKDWLAIAGPALEVLPDDRPEEKEAEKIEAKPRLKAVETSAGIWQVDIEVGEKSYEYIIPAGKRNDALQQAWNTYLNENTTASV